MNYQLIDIKTVAGTDGALSIFEAVKDVPFEIKRFYYIHGVKAGAVRGFHAHKTLCQMLFCPSGSIKIELDDGWEKQNVILDTPNIGLIVPHGVWHTMEWMTDQALLCVLASDYYKESDYIRNYSEFINYIKD